MEIYFTYFTYLATVTSLPLPLQNLRVLKILKLVIAKSSIYICVHVSIYVYCHNHCQQKKNTHAYM